MADSNNHEAELLKLTARYTECNEELMRRQSMVEFLSAKIKELQPLAIETRLCINSGATTPQDKIQWEKCRENLSEVIVATEKITENMKRLIHERKKVKDQIQTILNETETAISVEVAEGERALEFTANRLGSILKEINHNVD